MTVRLSDDLRRQIHVLDAWLKPTIDSQCPRQDAVKLRALRTNLVEIAGQIETMESVVPAPSLADSLEAFAESVAAYPDGMVLERQAVTLLLIALSSGAVLLGVLVYALGCHFGLIRPKLPWWWPGGAA